MGFNKCFTKIPNVYGGEGFLGVDIVSVELNRPLRLINIYGPCQNREAFWNMIMGVEFMKQENIIIGGPKFLPWVR